MKEKNIETATNMLDKAEDDFSVNVKSRMIPTAACHSAGGDNAYETEDK